MPILLQPSSPSTYPAGYYTSTDRMGNMIGISVVIQMSNVETSDQPNTLNTNLLTDVLQRTDNWVNRRLREANYQTPLSTSSADFGYISDIATMYAAYLLYMAKPETVTEDGDDPAGRFKTHRDHAEDEMSNLITRGIDGAETIAENHGIDVVRFQDIPTSSNITQIRTV